jgi:hypothetical protein
MTKAITVKVATPKVIAALEAKLEAVEKDYASQEVKEKAFGEAMEAWRKSIQEYAIANFKKAENIRVNHRSWNNMLNIDYDLSVKDGDVPKEPNREYQTMGHHEYKEIVADITNALNILRMTDEETVNASTMKSIARYL